MHSQGIISAGNYLAISAMRATAGRRVSVVAATQLVRPGHVYQAVSADTATRAAKASATG
jgi:hypothetical protein